jgi:transcriptional regulator with XRE-family HTH domain
MTSRFCDAFARCIAHKRMNQRQVADELGVSQQTVSRWVTGEVTPHADHYAELASFLEITEDDLIELFEAGGRLSLDDVSRDLDSLTDEVADLRRILLRLIANRPGLGLNE